MYHIYTLTKNIRKKLPINIKPHCHTYRKNPQDTHTHTHTHTEKKNNC